MGARDACASKNLKEIYSNKKQDSLPTHKTIKSRKDTLAKKYFKERDFITIQFNFVQSRFNSTEQKVYSEVAQNGIKSLPSQTDGQLL